jgi:hypothetical protein
MNSHLTLAAASAQQQDRRRAAEEARRAAAMAADPREPRTSRLRVLPTAARKASRAIGAFGRPTASERRVETPAID